MILPLIIFVAVLVAIPLLDRYEGRTACNFGAFTGLLAYIVFFSMTMGLGTLTAIFLLGGCILIYAVWSRVTNNPMKDKTEDHFYTAIKFLAIYIIWSYWVSLFWVQIFYPSMRVSMEVTMWSILLIGLLAVFGLILSWRVVYGALSFAKNAIAWIIGRAGLIKDKIREIT